MSDSTQKKELTLLFSIILIFGLFLTSLFIYEKKTLILEKTGHKVFNSFIGK